jgi:type IV pilus assembly protein PilM
MILEIFLPDKIGKTRLLSQRILGFSINEDVVSASKVYVSGSKTVVEKLAKETIEPGSDETYQQRAANAIKKIIADIGSYHKIRVAIPASLVVFKEHKVPFMDAHKIRMIIDYEIEPMLPFSLDDAVIDFVITEQFKEKQASQILVVASRIQDLEGVLSIYRAAGVEPDYLTVDLLALYGLYQQIPEYAAIGPGSVLIDLGQRFTRVAFLQNGELRLTRTIPKGIMTIVDQVSSETGIPFDQIQGHLDKYGVNKSGNETLDQSLETHLVNHLNDIQFTLNSFSLKLNFFEGIAKLLFTGVGAQLQGFMELVTSTLQITAQVFDAEKIFESKVIKNKVSRGIRSWHPYVFALATTLPSEEQSEFNLRRKKLALIRQDLIKKQVVIAAGIVVIMFAVVAGRGYLQLYGLNQIIKRTSQQEMKRLKKIFPPKSKVLKKTDLKRVLKDAEALVGEKEDMWAPFAQQRLRPLEIMHELTRIIDKKSFDVTVDEVIINTDEDGVPRVELTGFFRSKTGIDHFHHFGVFQKSFDEAKTLVLTEEIDPTLADDRGVKFTAKLKQKEI